MRVSRTVVAATALAVMGVFGGFLYAQPDGDEATEEDVPSPLADVVEKLTPKQMLDKSSELIEDMKGMLDRVLQLQQSARKQNDVLKLNCVNEKLLHLKQLLNIAEASRNNLTEAISTENEPERYHQFDQIKIAHEKAMEMRDEAEACIGEEIVFVGDRDVEVEGPDIQDDPTAQDPFDFVDPEIERPAFASPFY